MKVSLKKDGYCNTLKVRYYHPGTHEMNQNGVDITITVLNDYEIDVVSKNWR